MFRMFFTTKITNMADRQAALVVENVVLNVIDDDDENISRRGKDREWIKEREEKGYFNNIIADLSLGDTESFRRFMRMKHEHFLTLTRRPRLNISISGFRIMNTNRVEISSEFSHIRYCFVLREKVSTCR